MRFNTAISRLMELTTALQEASRQGPLPRAALETMVLLLSPLAPHLAEELWEKLGHRDSLAYQPWPEHDPAALVEETVEVAVQINGKVRDRIQVPPSITSDEIQAQALARDKVRDGVAGKQVVKAIYVPGKLLSLVVK
jgi:leucyl-tRNA synthetase